MVSPNANLARAHRFPIPAPAAFQEARSQNVLIRYDGEQRSLVGRPSEGGQRETNPHVYAVVSVSDLAKLPASVIEGIRFTEKRPDGSLRGSRDAFFVRSEEEVSLYVDTATYPRFVSGLIRAAGAKGVWEAKGDLNHMIGKHGDVEPPKVPAYVTLGYQRMPSREALAILTEARERLQQSETFEAEDEELADPFAIPGLEAGPRPSMG